MNKRGSFLLVATLVASAAVPSEAFADQPVAAVSTKNGTSPLSEADVINMSVRNNPDLRSAMLSEEQAQQAIRAEQARYPLILQANAGYTSAVSPSLGRNRIDTSARENVVIGSSLSKDFATGTSVSLSVQAERNTTNRAVGPNVTSGAAGTGYTLSSRLSMSQALLRGAGTRIGEADLRIARLNASSQKEARGRVTSEVLLDALGAYWELWYASRAYGIELAARDLATAERADADARQKQGAIPTADVLSFDSRVASLGEQVTAAELTELERGLELAQVLGVETPATPWRATGEPTDASSPTTSEVEGKLARQSPELKELEAKLAAAEARAQVAGDAYRPRLDVEGYVEVRGLGTTYPATDTQPSNYAYAATMSGYVGMVFEAPLTGARESVEVQKARLDVKLAQNQLDAARNRLKLGAARLVAQLDAAKARRAAAEQTATIAAKQLEAEKARYALGASTPIQVQTAEDSVRQARLRVARAQVDQVKAALEIHHSTGELLAHHASAVSATNP